MRAFMTLLMLGLVVVLAGCGAGAGAGGADLEVGSTGAARTARSVDPRSRTAGPGGMTEGAVPAGSPGEEHRMLTSDGAWSWLAGPRALHHEGDHRRTYTAWVNSIGDVRVASYDHDTGERQLVTIEESFQTDDHASPTLAVRPDGRVIVFYCKHRDRWLMSRTSVEPEDITAWGPVRYLKQYTPENHGNTDPRPVYLPGEADRLMLLWRGPRYDTYFATTDNGWDWTEPAPLIAAGETSPYFCVRGDRDRAIHIAITPEHPRREGGLRVLYALYEAYAVRRADGTPISGMVELPVELRECEVVYDGTASGTPAWVWDVADADGAPVIVYATFPTPDNHQYWYALRTTEGWERHEITAAGPGYTDAHPSSRWYDPYYSGGIALDPANPSVVYLSRQVEGVFEIERWETSDGGTTWERGAITSGSASDNVRPVVLRTSVTGAGTAEPPSTVYWMNGSYTNFSEYATSIRMYVEGE